MRRIFRSQRQLQCQRTTRLRTPTASKLSSVCIPHSYLCSPQSSTFSLFSAAAVPRRPTPQAAKPAHKPTTSARSPSGARSTCQDVESISEFTEEQPATHCGNQTILPPSSIAEFSTAPSAQSTSKARKSSTSKSSLTSLGPTPGERHNTTLDEFQPPVIDISDDSDYGIYNTPFLVQVSNYDTQTGIPRRKGNGLRNPRNLQKSMDPRRKHQLSQNLQTSLSLRLCIRWRWALRGRVRHSYLSRSRRCNLPWLHSSV